MAPLKATHFVSQRQAGTIAETTRNLHPPLLRTDNQTLTPTMFSLPSPNAMQLGMIQGVPQLLTFVGPVS